MNPEKEYYEKQELQKLIEDTDWCALLPILYAMTRRMIYKRFLSDPDKGIFSKTFKDFVHDSLTLFFEGKRRCPKDIRLEQFFYSTIRSIISKHIAKQFRTLGLDATEEEVLKVHYESLKTSFDVVKVKGFISVRMKDEICANIFDCWAEGIYQPSEIRDLFGYSEQDYNNAKKRLDRVLVDIRKHLINE